MNKKLLKYGTILTLTVFSVRHVTSLPPKVMSVIENKITYKEDGSMETIDTENIVAIKPVPSLYNKITLRYPIQLMVADENKQISLRVTEHQQMKIVRAMESTN